MLADKCAELTPNKQTYDDIKEQLVVRKMRQEILTDISVSPEEVKDFYESVPRDSLPYFSTQVKVSQIVKIPEVGKEQKDKTKGGILLPNSTKG